VATPDGRAVNRAPKLGLDVLDATRSALVADVTGDGAVNVLFAMGDSMAGFERDVDGRYEVALRFPADATTSLAAADVDLDGLLDVYVAGYANPYEGGALPLPYHDANNGVPNVLWKGLGGWSFRDATESLGLAENNRRFSFAASFSDVDLDGDPDLYVANDFGRNNLYLNRGAEGFRDVAEERGVEDIAAGMGVTFADVDLDGDEDLYVANMFSSAGHRVSFDADFRAGSDPEERAAFRRHARGNSLFLNDADGFAELAQERGVDMGWWSWGARFTDVDSDGWPDLAVPAGMVTRTDPDDL
ncbi:MAG: VCBS repeat-containing protein, partial [Planctomycetota bacterium]